MACLCRPGALSHSSSHLPKPWAASTSHQILTHDEANSLYHNISRMAMGLTRGLVLPQPAKAASLSHSINKINPNQITVKQLLTLIGKAIWFSLARRPLLSTLDAIFRHHENVRMQALAMPNERELRELRTLATLLPLSQVSLKLPWSPIIIAVDASLLGGAVVYTTTTSQMAMHLYRMFLQAAPHGNTVPNVHSNEGSAYLKELQAMIKQSKWITAYTHRWRWKEHIASLEASILSSSIEWAISKNLTSQQFIILTDSSATLGCMTKGRSSIRGLLARCRKAASLVHAHNLYPRLAFTPTSCNPADGPSRSF